MFLIRIFLLITPVIVKCGSLSHYFPFLAANFIYLRVDTSKVRHKSAKKEKLNGESIKEDVRLIADFLLSSQPYSDEETTRMEEDKDILRRVYILCQVDFNVMIGRRMAST